MNNEKMAEIRVYDMVLAIVTRGVGYIRTQKNMYVISVKSLGWVKKDLVIRIHGKEVHEASHIVFCI